MTPPSSASPPDAPRATRRRHEAHYHGETLVDDYHWLRDPNYPDVTHREILDYLEAENRYFEACIAPLKSQIDALFEELKARQPAEDASVPFEKNGYRYQWRYKKDAQYRTWYRAPVSDPDTWSVLLDETELAGAGDYFRLGALSVSPDATRLAYSTDSDGGERFTLHVIDIDTKDALTTPIENTSGSPIWSSRNDAVLYTILNEQWRPYQVWQRSIGEGRLAGEPDRLIYEEPDGSFFVGLELSQSEQYVFVSSGGHTQNEIRLLPRSDFTVPLELIAPRQAEHEYHLDHQDDAFLIRSNRRHANFDLYRAPVSDPGPANWDLWIRGDDRHYLTGHMALAGHVIVEERVDGLDQIRVIDASGAQHRVAFPEPAYTASLGTNPNYDTRTIRLGYTSLVTPQTVYDYDLNNRSLTTMKVQAIPSGYEPATFRTERLIATARDGSRIPLSVVYHADTALDGTAPLYLYGYGAYGIAIPPAFSASRLSLLERGFVFAIAHIRGGDDLGYHWYTQGKREQRTNTFNDFVDSAEHLIHEGYTGAGRIVIAGGSAGGELMGAAVNLAPSLWGAVAAHVPFVDVLNTMLDDTLPLTPMEWPEWGNPIEDAQAFNLIRSYSPYDQLRPGAYPPMLVTAGLNDPRVTYWEPAKYVAKIRHLKTDSNPLLLKTNMGAGHGGKSGRFEALRELAEEYAFFLNAMGHSPAD